MIRIYLLPKELQSQMFRNTHGVVFIDIKQQLFRNTRGVVFIDSSCLGTPVVVFIDSSCLGVPLVVFIDSSCLGTPGVVFMDSSCLGTPVVVFMDSSWRRETAKTPSGSGFKLFCRIPVQRKSKIFANRSFPLF